MSGIIIVTGSRSLAGTAFNRGRISALLAKFSREGYHKLYNGGCEGADTVCVDEWTRLNENNGHMTFRPCWSAGKGAGPARNALMTRRAVEETSTNSFCRPPILLAFPVQGSTNRGTLDCILKAFKLQIETRIFWMEAAND